MTPEQINASLERLHAYMMSRRRPPVGRTWPNYRMRVRNYLEGDLSPAEYVSAAPGQAEKRLRFYAIRVYLVCTEGSAARLKDEVENPAEPPLPQIEIPTIELMLDMLDWADTNIEMPWSLALRILYDAGLRISELIEANVGSFDGERGKLTIRGKGGKIGSSGLSLDTVDRLKAYLRWRRVGGERPPASAPLLMGGGENGRLTVNSLNRAAERMYEGVGWEGHQVYSRKCHLLRHICGTHLTSRGMDNISVAAHLRQAGTQIVARYIHFDTAQRIARHRSTHPLGDPAAAIAEEQELMNGSVKQRDSDRRQDGRVQRGKTNGLTLVESKDRRRA